jgi:hypothetical protein
MTSAFNLADFLNPDICDLDEAPLFPLEPRDKGPATEAQRQRTLLALVGRFAPSIIAFSVPNEGKRTDWEKINLARNGARAGAPDLLFFWNHGCAAIEMKSGTGMPSKAQIDMLNRLHRAGHRVGVFRKPETAFHWLREVGAPVPEVVL